MKREFDNLELRAAFREEPESCRRALMDAARSVREKKVTMRKNPVRTMLIAAVVAMTMLTTAFAAGEIFGWNDYFERLGIHTTPGMRDAMQMESQTYTVGPLNFTVQEAVSDNRYALVSTHIAPANGNIALMTQFADDAIGAYGERSRKLMGALGIEDKSLLCTEAAAMKNIPLYTVRACIEVEESLSGGEGMEDIMWDAQANVAYLSQHSLNPAAVGAELPVTLFLRVAQIDPATGEEIERWTTREALTISVGQKLAEKTYIPEAPYTVKGAALESIRAELCVTGAYLTFTWRMPEGVENNDDFSIWDYHSDAMLITDAAFNAFENGVSLSGGWDGAAWPTVTVEEMINVDALPEVIRVSDAQNDVTYK